ncbi:MAG: condensation domain-containing protein, partial [Ruminiclostridium sp.]
MITKYLDLTHPQKRIWYTQTLIDQSNLWNCGGLLRINKLLDFALLENVINTLIKKHSGMRLRIKNVEGEIKQYIEEYEYENFPRLYFYNENDIIHWAEQNFHEGFDDLNCRLYNIAIINLHDELTYCYFKYHHIIADGWCCNIFAKEISQIYNELINCENVSYRSDYTYLDYIKYENDYLLSSRFDKDQKYWMERFREIPGQIYNFKSYNSFQAKRQTYILPQSTSLAIKELCQQLKTSYNTFFLGILLIYIYKMHLIKNLTVGVPVLNRTGTIEKQIVGMCTSTLPFNYNIVDSMDITEFFKDLDRRMLRDFSHQRYPYDLLAADLQLAQKKIDNLYQIIFTYLNYSIDDIRIDDVKIDFIELFGGYQSVPLAIKVNEWAKDNSQAIIIDYNTTMFTDDEIQSI